MSKREAICERLEILEKSGLITARVRSRTDEIRNLLEKREKKPEGEKLEMFITHMAMALQRIENGQCEKPLDKAVVEELGEEREYPEALAFAKKIRETIDMELPVTEEEYMIVHLCNLFS